MKVLIIGGTKFIGKAIWEEAKKTGHDIVFFNRGISNTDHSIPLIKGDVENILDHSKEIQNHKFDVVVHCIAYTEKHAHDINTLFEGSDTRVIVLSSCDCYEAFQGLNRLKDLSQLPIDENSLLSQKKYYWNDTEVKGHEKETYDKNLVTEILLKAYEKNNLNVTVFRLPFVYGPGDYQFPGRHGPIIQKILRNINFILLSDREQCQIYTYGYVENIASAIIYSFDKKICNGKIYNLGDEKSISKRKWVEMYSRVSRHEINCIILPEELLRKDKSYRNAPPQNLLLDSSKFNIDTGFSNPISMEEAIKKTIQYATEYPEVLGDFPDGKIEKELVEKYHKLLDKMHLQY